MTAVLCRRPSLGIALAEAQTIGQCHAHCRRGRSGSASSTTDSECAVTPQPCPEKGRAGKHETRRRKLAQRLEILDTLERLENLKDLLLEDSEPPRPTDTKGGRSDDVALSVGLDAKVDVPATGPVATLDDSAGAGFSDEAAMALSLEIGAADDSARDTVDPEDVTEL